MLRRLIRDLFAALLVVVLVGVPVFALQASNPVGAPQVLPQTEPEEPAVTTQQEHDNGAGNCHGLQRAYWALSGNRGKGEGKEEAAAALAQKALDRGCELSDAPPDGFPGRGRPEWAGGRPEWAGTGKGDGNGPPWAEEGDGPPWGPPPWARRGHDGESHGEGRKGPKWATEGDGPPWGLAWGHWLKHGGEGVCARISARLEAHPDASVPEDLRARITSELGCNLPG